MSRYDTYKAGDDRKLEEQELGFKGFNDRLRPDQIQSGLLQKSENARLDLNGQWQSRKGVQNRLSPFAVSGTALRLPTEDEVTAGTVTLLSHSILTASAASDGSDGTITLTTGSVHQEGIATRVGSTTTAQIQFKNVNFSTMTEIIVGTNIVVSGATYSGTGGSGAVNTTQSVTAITTTGNTSNDTLQFTVSGLDAAVSGDAVIITVAQNHNLAVGDTIEVNDIAISGGGGTVANVNGTQTTITDTTGNTIKYTVEGITSAPTLTITDGSSFGSSLVSGTTAETTVTDADASGGTVTRDGTNMKITFDQNLATVFGLKALSPITVSGVTGGGSASGTGSSAPSDKVNGDHFITSLSDAGGVTNSVINITIASLDSSVAGTVVVKTAAPKFAFTPQELTTGTPPKFLPCAGAVILNDSAVSEVTCGCKFSDPNETTEEEYILLASNAKVVAFNTSTLESFDMPLKSGETIPEDSSILQVFDKVIIFRGGQISLENDKFFSPFTISAASSSGTTRTITTFGNHGLQTGDSVDISGVTATETYIGQYQITRTGATTFTYTATGSGSSATTLSDAKVSPTFLLVPNGAFTQPVKLSATGFVITNGVATATVSNTLSKGDTVVLTVAGSSTLTAFTEFTVSEATTSLFKFFVNSSDVTNQNDVIFTQKVSEGLGFTHSPAPNFGAYHNKRLVVPYNFEITGSSGSATITDRNIKDEVLISDILDSDTFDQIFSQFRFNAGGADFVVGFQSFANDQLIIFNRNSIHTVNNTVNLVSSTVKQVTDEVGCIARGSIEQIGSEILFLSDNGVYGISFVDEYNLRGTALPLSESINKTIQRINKAHADKAVSAYFDNRYYLAVALDDAIENNAVIIYNFLNKQWESIDTYGNGTTTFDILDLIVAGKGTNRAVYAINKQGGIHQLDVNESGQDAIISTLGQETATAVEVDAKARTRQFTIGSIDRKKWNDFEIHAESGITYPTDFSIVANTENIDEENINLNSLKSLNGGSNLAAEEDVAIRGRIGNKRAYGLDIEITRVTGRPKLRAVKVSGVETFRSTNKAI